VPFAEGHVTRAKQLAAATCQQFKPDGYHNGQNKNSQSRARQAHTQFHWVGLLLLRAYILRSCAAHNSPAHTWLCHIGSICTAHLLPCHSYCIMFITTHAQFGAKTHTCNSPNKRFTAQTSLSGTAEALHTRAVDNPRVTKRAHIRQGAIQLT
jgi:hypothetical protein